MANNGCTISLKSAVDDGTVCIPSSANIFPVYPNLTWTKESMNLESDMRPRRGRKVIASAKRGYIRVRIRKEIVRQIITHMIERQVIHKIAEN